MNLALKLDRTLAIIKPHAIKQHFDIIRKILAAGFHVLQERCVKLSTEQAEKFYENQPCNNKKSWDIFELSSGPLIALCLSRENSIEKWKNLMGPENIIEAREKAPTCIRSLYGIDDIKNAVFGSHDESHVHDDIHFFFPNIIPEHRFYQMENIRNYLCHVMLKPLVNALYELLKIKPSEPLEWIANFMQENNSTQPTHHISCANTLSLLHELIEKENWQMKMKFEEEMNSKKPKCGCSLSSVSNSSSF